MTIIRLSTLFLLMLLSVTQGCKKKDDPEPVEPKPNCVEYATDIDREKALKKIAAKHYPKMAEWTFNRGSKNYRSITNAQVCGIENGTFGNDGFGGLKLTLKTGEVVLLGDYNYYVEIRVIRINGAEETTLSTHEWVRP